MSVRDQADRGNLAAHYSYLNPIFQNDSSERERNNLFCPGESIWWRRRPAGGFFYLRHGAKTPATRRRYETPLDADLRDCEIHSRTCSSRISSGRVPFRNTTS